MPVLDSILEGWKIAGREPGDNFRMVEPGEDILADYTNLEYVDLRNCGDPYRMERKDLVQQILLPAFHHGELPKTTEAKLLRETAKMPLWDLKEWAAEVLRSNPWPPGFKLPTFREFVENTDYLGDGSTKLTPRQRHAIENSIGPDARAWFVTPRSVSTAILCWGKGAGKDLLSSFVIAYSAWAIMYMRNPWFHFKMPAGEVLDILNVAQDKDSAERVFFTKLKNNLQKACFRPLFENQAKDITADAAMFKKKVPGEMFSRPCVRINSLHSGNEKAEGRNTLLYVMDEADAMRDSTGHGNAHKMFSTLTTSNRFESKQLGFIISYPRAKNGFMFELLPKCGNRGGTTTEWWGDLAPTYEILPWKTFMPLDVNGVTKWTNPGGHIANLPDSEMARIYRDDVELFRAMYSCEPPAAEDAFITMPEKIDECILPFILPIAIVEPTTREEVDTLTQELRKYVGLSLTNIKMRRGVTYFIGGDAGETQDSFALCVAHVVPPSENGFLSPDAWRDARHRYAKHYRPEPLPTHKSWDPKEWKCDVTGVVPVPGKHKFWGVCRPSGRQAMRQVQTGVDEATGEPIYLQDADGAVVMEEIYLPRIVEDLLLEWKPDRSKRMPVDFRNVRDLILELAKHGQIGMCLFDRWQAVALIQDLRAAGIPAESKQFSNVAQVEWYRNFKTLIYNNQVELLPGEDRARRQLRELQLINGNKIDHPSYGSGGESRGAKDLPDAEALAFWLCSCPQYAPARIDTGSIAPYFGMAQQAQAINRRTAQDQGLVNSMLRGLI